MSQQAVTIETSEPAKFFTSVKHIAQRTVSFPCVTPLKGHEDYDLWASTMEAVWRSLKLHELVVDGKRPEPGSGPEEIEAFDAMFHFAIGLYLQVVGPSVIKHIVDLKNPHEMWMHLKSEYKRGSSFGLVFQLGKIMDIHNSIENPTSISSLVRQFESEWLMLCKLAGDSTDDYRILLAQCFSMDKAKRDFLLGMLSRRHKNAVNNLITRDDFSYGQVKQHLFDMDYDPPSQNSAFLTERQNGKSTAPKPSGPHKVGRKRTCAYCLKHFPAQAKGHTWQYCRKKKAAESKNKNNKPTDDEAYMTSLSTEQVSITPFYLDTCATAHMCPYPDRFETLSVSTGRVKTSSGQGMAVKGIGSIVLKCILSDGTYSCFRIYDVL